MNILNYFGADAIRDWEEENGEAMKKQKEEPAKSFDEVPHPWLRFFARSVDALIIGIPFIPLYYFDLGLWEALVSMFILFVWVFVEAYCLSTWGTTPGKKMFGITVRDRLGEKLTRKQALKRSFSVWLRGLGIGAPVISIVTMVYAKIVLSREGITHYDRNGGYSVAHKKPTTTGITLAVAVLVGVFILLGFVRSML